MIAVILGILKIIGILLLVLLGLILFVILSILFVPVRYRAEGSLYECLKGNASVSWFLHLIFLTVSYDGEARMDIRILWFHPGVKEDENEETVPEVTEAVRKEKTEHVPEHVRAETKKAAEDAAEHTPADAADPREELAERVETAQVSVPEQTDHKNREESGNAHAEASPNGQEERGFGLHALSGRIGRLIASLKEKIRTFRKKWKAAAKKLRKGKAQWETICSFLQNEENKKAFRLVKKQVFALIRHVFPRKLEGTIRFGLGDPYMTGQVLTWISPFYGLYGRHVQVTPDFLETCLEGELKLKGHIRLGTLLFLVFRMLQNKNIRLWIKKWREA